MVAFVMLADFRTIVLNKIGTPLRNSDLELSVVKTIEGPQIPVANSTPS